MLKLEFGETVHNTVQEEPKVIKITNHLQNHKNEQTINLGER